MSDGILKSLESSIEQFVLFLHQIKSDQINYAMKDYSLYFGFQALLYTITAIGFVIIYIMQTKYEERARKLFTARKLDHHHHHHMTKMDIDLMYVCYIILSLYSYLNLPCVSSSSSCSNRSSSSSNRSSYFTVYSYLYRY